ncbi:MAG: tetratricopeptide repeat protein [Cytophagaceae bacterium]|jgi:tetratricopeptide (TPR) repeat protein|nr:tetratricopeptide repeat protein [Cytophagaceae bacterium]
MKSLSPVIEKRIESICAQADALFDDEKCEAALVAYEEALSLLPEPMEEYEPSAWLLSSMGDVYLFLEKYEQALLQYEHALDCVDSEDNPYLYLRIGQTLYELHRDDEAAESLYEAYLIEGEDIFAEEDPAYLAFLKSKKTLPE